MSWFTDLANKAENFLNTLDKSAAEVFDKSSISNQYTSDTKILFDYVDEVNSPNLSHHTLPIHVNRINESVKTNNSFDKLNQNNNVFNSNLLSSSQNSKKFATSKHVDQSNNLDLFDIFNVPTTTATINKLSDNTYQSKTQSISNNCQNELLVDDENSSGYETIDSINKSIENNNCTKINLTNDASSLSNSNLINSIDPIDLNSNQLSNKIKQTDQSQLSDLCLENKLLHSEVSSVNQELSNLLRRNHKASEEIKQLTSQVERLTNSLRDSDSRVRELQLQLKDKEQSKIEINSGILESKLKLIQDELSTAKNDLNLANSQIDANKQTIATLEANLRELRQQSFIADKRADLAQKETCRLARELTQYKEKANHILTMKERVIASLRGQDIGDSPFGSNDLGEQNQENSENELIRSIRAECDLLKEESTRWRLEVENSEMSVQELELQMQAERASLRRNIDLLERQVEREKQLREDADSELVQLRQRVRDMEQTFSRQKLDLHGQIIANESEINRLRQLVGRNQLSDDNNFMKSHDVLHSDPANVVTLESRIRQLTDNLLSKQDALDSVLGQNHALKIRLDRLQNDNESLMIAVSRNSNELNFETGKSFPINQFGCNRLNLNNTSLPRILRLLAYRVDGFGIKLANLFRYFPLIRLFFIFYLIFIHLWLLITYFVTIPSTISNTSSSIPIKPGDQIKLAP